MFNKIIEKKWVDIFVKKFNGIKTLLANTFATKVDLEARIHSLLDVIYASAVVNKTKASKINQVILEGKQAKFAEELLSDSLKRIKEDELSRMKLVVKSSKELSKLSNKKDSNKKTNVKKIKKTTKK